MNALDRLLGLIQQVYAAPGSQEGWQAFLDNLCTALNGSAAHFISHDLALHRGGVTVTAQMDPAALSAYNEHWAGLDPWIYSPRRQEFSHGAVALGDQLVSHLELRQTGYYADFARLYDYVRIIGSVVESGPGVVSVVSINGGERRNPFGQNEQVLLQALVPHIRRALQLHRRLAAAESTADTLGCVIQNASHAVLFVDGCGQVTYLNRTAEKLVAAGDGLVVADRKLQATRPADTIHLHRLVAKAAATWAGEDIDSGGVIAVGRQSGRRPLMVLVSPLSRRGTYPPDVRPAAAAAMVIVTDPESTEIPAEHDLGAMFGLTPAEAKLTRLVVRGFTLAEAAARLGLRIQTVRTRTKAIFEKTSTHRQADLVRLVLNGMRQL